MRGGSRPEVHPAVPGSAAGVVVVAVKCCREAPGQRLCAALEGCGRHNALGTVTGRELGRAGEPRTDQLAAADSPGTVQPLLSGALHGSRSWLCCFRAVIATLDGQSPDLFPFSQNKPEYSLLRSDK